MEIMQFGIRKSGARKVRLLGVVLSLGSLMLLNTAGVFATREATVQVQQDGAYENEMVKGHEFMRLHKYEEALKSFKRANEMRDKRSPDSFICLAEAYQELGAYKNVMESCDKAMEFAGNEASLKARACNLKGVAIQSSAAGKDQKKLKEAEVFFRQALALDGSLPIIHFNLGIMLMQQARDSDGVVELKKFVEMQPSGAKSDLARKMIENPQRARENYAPDFSIVTSDGEYITLEDLRGKVVLLDFWATWCHPCVESVPSLLNLHKKYAKESPLVIIGVSSDSEAEEWQDFTVQNKMVWPQYLDRDWHVQRAFGVRGYPTYIILDHEGAIKYRGVGWGPDREATIEDVIRKQVKIAEKALASR